MENFMLLLLFGVGSFSILFCAGFALVFMLTNFSHNCRELWRMFKHTNQSNWWEREMERSHDGEHN